MGLALAVAGLVVGTTAEQAKPTTGPTFRIDPSWPQEFPNHWVMGSVTGVFVDSKDHVWITSLPALRRGGCPLDPETPR